MRKIPVGILSLGCPRNLVDSEHLLGRLRLKGHPVVDITQAKVAIINTCAFVQDAKAESIEAILDCIQLKKQGKLEKIVVCGCLSQRYRELLARQLPEVDAFVGTLRLGQAPRFPLTPRHSAYIKVSEGCINNCSFCIIPRLKPGFQSLPETAVLSRLKEFQRSRVREVNIIGQDVTGYGLDTWGAPDLRRLLESMLRAAPGIPWFRLLYLYPSRVGKDLLELIRDQPRICKYIDVPVQHISGRILRAMNRSTSRSSVRELIALIRRTVPQAAIRTSVIVGFPSETDREFEELLDFIRESRFERLGAFIYSREEGTKASGMSGQVPRKVKEARFDAVMSLQQDISRQINQTLLGRALEVLVEEADPVDPTAAADGYFHYTARSQFDAPEVDGLVYLRSRKKIPIGSLVNARIYDTLEYDLVGETD